MSSSIKKANMIPQIVRLKQVVQRWKNKAFTRRSCSLTFSESDIPECDSNQRRTPRGCVALYVGPSRRRFVIPTRFLNLPAFADLLHQTEEEFGFQNDGPIFITCEPGLFREILRFIEEDEEKVRGLGLEELLRFVEMGFDESSCKGSSSSAKCQSFTPLLLKS